MRAWKVDRVWTQIGSVCDHKQDNVRQTLNWMHCIQPVGGWVVLSSRLLGVWYSEYLYIEGEYLYIEGEYCWIHESTTITIRTEITSI